MPTAAKGSSVWLSGAQLWSPEGLRLSPSSHSLLGDLVTSPNLIPLLQCKGQCSWLLGREAAYKGSAQGDSYGTMESPVPTFSPSPPLNDPTDLLPPPSLLRPPLNDHICQLLSHFLRG